MTERIFVQFGTLPTCARSNWFSSVFVEAVVQFVVVVFVEAPELASVVFVTVIAAAVAEFLLRRHILFELHI